ncbi:MAG: 6-bladed beta-propeller [Candidatus Aminicenantales bacterium]
MKKLCFALGAIMLLVGCGSNRDRVEKTLENGVEVVFNHLEPYQIKGESGRLRLEKQFSIDLENSELLKIGLTDIETFDIDSDGMIYVIQWHVKGDYIYKFDGNGKFLGSFCRYGQGPGEIEWGGIVMAVGDGEIIAKDPSKRKFLVYSRDGKFLRETPLPNVLEIEARFDDGTYLVHWQDQFSDPNNLIDHVALCDSTFASMNEILLYKFPNALRAEKIVVGEATYIIGASKDRIFIGDSRRGYEIEVRDRTGRIVRKIRKAYTPVNIDEKFKTVYLARFRDGDPWKSKYQFAKSWPPFRYMFTDDEGRLFVMTREPGAKPGEFTYDIFDKAGAFIGRTSLGNSDPYHPRTAVAMMGRIYSLNNSDSGYKELVVYKAIWE